MISRILKKFWREIKRVEDKPMIDGGCNGLLFEHEPKLSGYCRMEEKMKNTGGVLIQH